MNDELKVFRDALPDLRRWQQRAKQLERPEPGSDLAEDDSAFSYQPISETVRLSLISAGEHLRLVWDGLELKNYYTMSQYSAVRTAIVGAAQAVWVLAPNEPTTRRERGYIAITDTYVQLRKYHELVLRQATELQRLQLTPEREAKLRDQIAWVESREAAVRALRTGQAMLNVAAFIEAAAPEIFPGDEFRQAGLRQAWNILSSDAHVLSWSLAMRTTFATPADNLTGLSTGAADGRSLGGLAAWFSLAMHSLRRGWSLFDRRCEGR
ncbi:MAG: hypothetical protein WBA97_33470 [Actinophytocola sp.]|uniref:hypothetical protein n=1 Tax=Actinophytocola sp. TaxID=1872138 RepID=UPI003C71095F